MVMYLKSSFSINSYDGCNIGCKYCILSTLEDRNKLTKIADEKELVKELKEYKFYTPHIPITINNITDAFLNQKVFDSTLEILKEIKASNLKNPCVLISKGYLNQEQVDKLDDLNMNIVCLYTLSGLSEKLENRIEKRQIETIELLSKKKNIKLMHYYRPIIEGVNSDKETIKHIAKIAVKYFKGSIIAGIRINSHLKNVFKELNIDIPFKFDTEHKVILNDTYNRVLDTFKEIDPNYPCFKKTSCGVGYINQMADYNGHSGRIDYCSPQCPSYNICFAGGSIGFCNESCPNFARCKESSLAHISNNDVERLLNIIGKDRVFEIKERVIHIEGDFTQEEITFLRHNLKRNVKVDKTIRCNNEDKLSR